MNVDYFWHSFLKSRREMMNASASKLRRPSQQFARIWANVKQRRCSLCERHPHMTISIIDADANNKYSAGVRSSRPKIRLLSLDERGAKQRVFTLFVK